MMAELYYLIKQTVCYFEWSLMAYVLAFIRKFSVPWELRRLFTTKLASISRGFEKEQAGDCTSWHNSKRRLHIDEEIIWTWRNYCEVRRVCGESERGQEKHRKSASLERPGRIWNQSNEVTKQQTNKMKNLEKVLERLIVYWKFSKSPNIKFSWREGRNALVRRQTQKPSKTCKNNDALRQHRFTGNAKHEIFIYDGNIGNPLDMSHYQSAPNPLNSSQEMKKLPSNLHTRKPTKHKIHTKKS